MDEGVVLSVLAEHDASGASTTLRRIVSITVFVPARSIQLDLVRQAPRAQDRVIGQVGVLHSARPGTTTQLAIPDALLAITGTYVVVAHSTDGKSPHLRVSSNAFEVAPPPVATSIGNPLSASPAPSIAAAATSAVSAAPLETSGDGADASDSLTNDSDSSSSRRRRRRSHIFPSGTASAAAVAAIVAAANASPTAAGSVTSPPSTPASLTSSSGGASGGGSRVSRPSSTRGDEEMRRSSRHRTHRGDHHHHHHHKQPQQQQQQQLPAASSPRLQSSDSGSGTKVEDEQAATNTGGTVDISIRGSGNLRRAGSLARSGSPRHESSPRSLAKASSPLGGEDDIAGGGGGGGDSNGSGSVSPQRIDLRASPGQQPPPLPPSPSFRPSVVEREPPPLPSSDTLGELPSHPKSLSLGDSARRASVLSAQSVPSASNDEDDIDFDVHSSESSAGDSHDESDSDADDNAAGDANDEKPERTAAPAATRTTVAQRTVPVLSIAGAEKRKFAARGSVGGGVGDDDSSGGDEPGGESLSSHDMRFRRLMAMGAVGRAELLGVPALFLKAPTAKPDPRDINRPLPDTSQTLLHVAAVEGDLRGVRWLISHGALVDARDREGLTPLHYAIGLGRIGVARVLLEKEANPNAMTMVAWDAPAHFAARLPSSPELLALLDVLAENGALFDLPNKIDDTPLHEAAVGGERALLKWLLAAPGGRQLNVNAPNRFGDTPLHKAARAGNADAVRIMLRGGADINAVSESGTAADIAESCAHTHVADVLLEESGLRATPRAQPQYRIDMRPGNAEDISLRIDLSGLGMGNRFTPRTPRSPGSFGMRSRNKQWTRIMLRSPRPNNDKSDDSTPSSPSTGEPTSTVVSDGEQLSLLRTTNKKWVLRRPSPSTSNASSASNSGVWKKEFLVEPDAALDGDYVRSMLEKVDAEIASAGTDNSDDDDAIGEPAVTAAAATANSPTKDNASAATSATPPKKSEQEARNANAAAPQQPQAATGDAPQKKGSNRRRRRHRRPDDLPESATPAAVGATAAAAAAAAGATATPAAAAANSSSAATAVAAAVSTPMPTNATQQATVPSPPIEQASVICEGGACERCLAQSSSRCRWRCESLNRDVKLCSDCVRIMRETPNRCGLLLGTSDLTEFVGEKPASFDVHLLDEEELDIAATIQLDLQWDTWEFRDNFVRSDGQLERHKNCIGLSPFSPPVIVTFASELDKTALSFLAVVHSVADDYVYRVPVAVLKDKRAPTSKQLLHALSVMLERQYGPCVAVDLRSSNASGASTSASAGEPAPDFWRRWSAYRWVKVRDPALTIALLEFELHIKPTNYKFGVVLAPSGRTKVDEMLQVENATPAFNAFLNILGERIALRGWSGYRGDLDISSNCRTGERSVYAELDECQIMYHVSTMLPSDPHDAQQTARRMYLLSDIVVVVFLEGGHFSPHEFAAMSKQIHVILVVEPVVTGATTSYRLSVCARRDVPEFGPLIPHNFFFQPDDFFRDFLRTKMVNAERAALQAPFFARYVQRARRGQLTRLTEKFYDDGEEVGALSEPESGLQASGIKSKLRALGKRSSLSLAHSPIK